MHCHFAIISPYCTIVHYLFSRTKSGHIVRWKHVRANNGFIHSLWHTPLRSFQNHKNMKAASKHLSPNWGFWMGFYSALTIAVSVPPFQKATAFPWPPDRSEVYTPDTVLGQSQRWLGMKPSWQVAGENRPEEGVWLTKKVRSTCNVQIIWYENITFNEWCTCIYNMFAYVEHVQLV